MTGFPAQMLRREQLARAVEGALQQMEEDQAGQRRSGSLVSMHSQRKGQCPELGWLLPFNTALASQITSMIGVLPPQGAYTPLLRPLFQASGIPRAWHDPDCPHRINDCCS